MPETLGHCLLPLLCPHPLPDPEGSELKDALEVVAKGEAELERPAGNDERDAVRVGDDEPGAVEGIGAELSHNPRGLLLDSRPTGASDDPDAGPEEGTTAVVDSLPLGEARESQGPHESVELLERLADEPGAHGSRSV